MFFSSWSIVAHGPGGPVANAADWVERQPFGARVLPSEQRTVFRLGARYELSARERMRETAHVQALDVPVAVYPHFTLERHLLFAGVGRLFRFRVVGVLFLRVVVQILRRRRPDGCTGQVQRSGSGRASAQQEGLPGRGGRRSGRDHSRWRLRQRLSGRRHRGESVVGLER